MSKMLLTIACLIAVAAPIAVADPEPAPPATKVVAKVTPPKADDAAAGLAQPPGPATPSFGFRGPATGTAKPLARIVLPRETTSAKFQGFGCAAGCCADGDAEDVEETADARVVREVYVPDDGQGSDCAPRRRVVDGYNPVNPDTACYTNHYSVCRTSRCDGCTTCSTCSRCDSRCACTSCTTVCDPCVRPRYVRRVCYRPVVYVRPACGYGWGGGCGWGGHGWRGYGWRGYGWRGYGWGGYGWGGHGWGWRGGWGWGGCW